ncbi:hypothetical protein XELAEV_18023911mg [Xenopus laevis]|uniref:Uncharacterized protein n=1 Tax=Xenopus laevis TaxID=8355 RepID=A0A974D7V6_XENLA|nr:hypothetical protein XELAEV_18023911mg [Xenopus laevis]
MALGLFGTALGLRRGFGSIWCSVGGDVCLILCVKCPTTGLDLPVAADFCSINHIIDDLQVTVLMGNFKTQQERKEWEYKFMPKFNTLQYGLNKDRSFMARHEYG